MASNLAKNKTVNERPTRLESCDQMKLMCLLATGQNFLFWAYNITEV